MSSGLKLTFPPSSELELNIQHERALSVESVDGGWTKLHHHQHHHHHHHHRPATSSSQDMPLNRSHPSWFPRRPTVHSVSSPSHIVNASNATFTSGHFSSSKIKGKERSPGSVDSDPLGFGSTHGHNIDNFGVRSSDSSTTTHDPSHSHSSSSFPSRHRTSLLSVASDALGLRKKIGSVSRKKPNCHSVPYSTDVMPGVIEINAHDNTTITSTIGGTTAHMDYEYEERERLRDAAAQSIGLDPELLHDSCRSESHSFLDSPQSPLQPACLPSFPATLATLQPFIELSATLPKFTPPSSLFFALAKQWKPRTILLTVHSTSQKIHVHLFKGISKDEKEVERLEVIEDSVIFVSEEDVGGRGNVVKFAGKDVSAKRSGSVGEGNSRTMWFLQITDPAESQRWIAAIKNAVLAQRAVRVGLDIPARINRGNEPKGDMDVMLSMHLQGLISTHPTKLSAAISPPSPPAVGSPSPPPSLRSLKINIPLSPSPTNAMKGIISGTRPRSPSVEGSPTLPYPSGHTEDSFGAAGASLLTMLRTKSSTDSGSSPSHSLPLPLPLVQGRGSPAPSLRSTHAPVVITASDLKISRERDTPELSNVIPDIGSSSLAVGSNTPIPSLPAKGTFTLSLQPPPRKCKYAFATAPAMFPHEQQGLYKQAGGNRSVAGNFGIPSKGSDDVVSGQISPVSPDSSSFLAGQSGSFSSSSGIMVVPTEVRDNEQNNEVPTRPGNGMTDTSSSRTAPVPTDKLSPSAVITKRWSRQCVTLPKQLTPPIGPPPSIPSSPESNHRMSVESSISVSITYAVDRPPSTSSSNSHSQVRISPRSGSSLSPTFWRRASGSSVYSAKSASESDSRGQPQIPLPFGGESPSSTALRPLVGNGNGASSRPMSLSVLGSLPVAHIGTAKRRSMPPPRPAPNFAPPPAPTVQGSTSLPASSTIPPSAPQKFFRSAVAKRALRRSLTSPKPPPSTALPPRPDEVTFTHGHRRSSSAGTPDVTPSSRPSSALSGNWTPTQPTSPPARSLSIRQRLRILSTPPTSLSPVQPPSPAMPSIQVSTLDMSDDNDDDLPTPYFPPSQPFGLGEHIIKMQNDPSFLHLSTPATPIISKPPPRSPFRQTPPSSSSTDSLRVPPPEPDRDFVALSPPPRRGSKPLAAMVIRPEKLETEGLASTQGEESRLVALSHHGSVVSLGFVVT